jgi:hypothetical protein
MQSLGDTDLLIEWLTELTDSIFHFLSTLFIFRFIYLFVH